MSRLEALLAALVNEGSTDIGDVAPLARATPAGSVDLPVAVVDLDAAVAATGQLDEVWLRTVERQRALSREAVADAELEAALHVAVPLAVERFDPADDTDVNAHVASGGRLWLLTAAVASALGEADPDPFGPWARLVLAGWWPVGPCRGDLVVSRAR